jgi:hypothetical protein
MGRIICRGKVAKSYKSSKSIPIYGLIPVALVGDIVIDSPQEGLGEGEGEGEVG